MLEELNLSEEQLEGVQKYLQSEGDKIRGKYSKQIKELESKLPKEKTEEELAFEKRVAELETREKELAKKERLTTAKGILSSKGLDSQLTDYLNFEGVEDLETYVDNIAKVVGKQAKSYVPKGHEKADGNITKEQFSKMSYTERCNLYETNKPLYEILSK
ncbi:capsid assembly scaffolding protein Gp46 family protein [Clostridium perfringens]